MAKPWASVTAETRFWRKVEVTDSAKCWIWNGKKDADGYGRFYVVGTKDVAAHRWAYEALVQPISEGLVIDHLCRNRACVNPEHMECVTGVENSRRQERATWTECIHGHPFDDENTYWRPSGQRDCRACGRERQRRAKAKRASVGGAA